MKYSQKSLISRVERETKNSLIIPGDIIIVALSGGPDSVCLLDVLDKLKDSFPFRLKVCHFNHKIRGEESDKDEQFVLKFCRQRGIECYFGSAGDKEILKNEERARLARYHFFEKILQADRGAKIALAHNADDLAETVIYRLIRGSGLQGLRGILRQRKKFIRPLLSISRSEIMTYLEQNDLDYRIDSSNADIRFSRNFLRLKVIPLLRKLNPNLSETLSQTARLVKDDYDYLNKAAEEAYRDLALVEEKNKIELDHIKWLCLHPAIQKLVLRQSLQKIADLRDITAGQLMEVCNLLGKKIGRKYKPLPHSLRIELVSGKIIFVRKTEDTN